MLENVPQIIVQGIWIYINGLQDETLLALTASSLSIVATLLIFWGERQLDAHYVVSTYFIALRTHGIILKDERAAMDNKKKLRNALKNKLAAVLGSRDKEIQIGCVTQRDCGLVIHVQQLVFSKQLDLYKERVNRYNINPEQYMKELFRSKIDRISDAVCDHFEIENKRRKEYIVSYQKDLKTQKSMTCLSIDDVNSEEISTTNDHPGFGHNGNSNDHFVATRCETLRSTMEGIRMKSHSTRLKKDCSWDNLVLERGITARSPSVARLAALPDGNENVTTNGAKNNAKNDATNDGTNVDVVHLLSAMKKQFEQQLNQLAVMITQHATPSQPSLLQVPTPQNGTPLESADNDGNVILQSYYDDLSDDESVKL